MNKKINFIIIILVLFVVFGLGMSMILYNEKIKADKAIAALVQDKEALTNENQKARSELINAKDKEKKLIEQKETMAKELDRVEKELGELSKKYETVEKERTSLAETLKQMGDKEKLGPGRQNTEAASSQTQTGTTQQDSYWAGVIKEKASLELQLTSLKETIEGLESKKSEALNEKKQLELELKAITQERDDLGRQLDYNRRLADTLSSDLVREKQDGQLIKKQINTLKEENYVLSNQLKQTMQAKLNLERKIEDTEKQNIDLTSRLTQASQVLDTRVEELLDIQKEIQSSSAGLSSSKESVELPPIVVKSKAEALSQNRQEQMMPFSETSVGDSSAGFLASIVSIDERNNFVIVDKGKNNGIKMGQRFEVYSGVKKVATLEVIQLRDDISACDITSRSGSIAVGNKVR